MDEEGGAKINGEVWPSMSRDKGRDWALRTATAYLLYSPSLSTPDSQDIKSIFIQS